MLRTTLLSASARLSLQAEATTADVHSAPRKSASSEGESSRVPSTRIPSEQTTDPKEIEDSKSAPMELLQLKACELRPLCDVLSVIAEAL